MTSTDIVEYYRARSHEYEQVYAKPERQADLARLHAVIPEAFSGRSVLEIACGTGYWTRRVAIRAAAVTACDRAPEVLELARLHQPRERPVTFILADAFALDDVPGDFDAGLAAFWWSHVPRADIPRFLNGLHRRLPAGSRILIVDNRYVEGSNHPITRVDDQGNTYQRRRLNSGAEYEVLKNFPRPDQVREDLAIAGGSAISVHVLEYYWYATYELASAI